MGVLIMKQKPTIIIISDNLFRKRIKPNATYLTFLFTFLVYFNVIFAQVGILTDTPHASSALEIESSNKGILVPRINLSTSITSPSPVSSPAVGLLIFNSGTNQPEGFYYWNGSQWVSTSYSTSNWDITGNNSTSISSNFLGTTDNQHLAIRTNNNERIRIESDGQVVIGATNPIDDADLFTVQGNSSQYSAINAYSPDGYGIYAEAGSIGVLGVVNNDGGFGFWGENEDNDGYGAIISGSNTGAFTLNNHSSGLSSHGSDGIFCIGHSSKGIGIIAGGNNVSTLSTIDDGTGGAFTGYHGVYASAINSSSGTGVIGVGNDIGTYHSTSNGSGGAFTGYHGSFSFSAASGGTGVIGIGNNGAYYLTMDGSGGAFTGRRYGVAGWSTGFGGYGVYGQAVGGGYGVFSSGNFGATGSKSFVIDHPLDPQNKILKHYSIESPEVLNMYRGNIILNENGEGEIILPDYFMSININYSYVLTAIGKPAPSIYIRSEINENGEFTISGGESGQKISWVVYSERNDVYLQQNPNSKKVVINKDEWQKGKYLNPELYNQPQSKGIFYREEEDAIFQKGQKTTKTEINTIVSPSKN